MTNATTDNPVVVPPLTGFAVATEEDAHQPAVPAATHDLPGFSGQTQILPKIWHTTGTPAQEMTLSIQRLGGKEE